MRQGRDVGPTPKTRQQLPPPPLSPPYLLDVQSHQVKRVHQPLALALRRRQRQPLSGRRHRRNIGYIQVLDHLWWERREGRWISIHKDNFFYPLAKPSSFIGTPLPRTAYASPLLKQRRFSPPPQAAQVFPPPAWKPTLRSASTTSTRPSVATSSSGPAATSSSAGCGSATTERGRRGSS